MGTPIIQSVGSSSGAGTAGQGRNNLVAGETISLSDTNLANVGSVYFWELVDAPIGTSPTLLNPSTSTPSFIVDPDATLAGSYRIRCTVDGFETATEVFAKPLRLTGARITSFQEELEYDAGGNTKGWHEAQTRFMRQVDEKLRDRGPGAAGEQLVYSLWAGGHEVHDSDTPLGVGAFALNPNVYSLTRTTMSLQFIVVASCGGTPLDCHVELYNLTDRELVASSVVDIIDTTSPTRYTATLLVGTAAGKIKSSGERLYECRIFRDTPGVVTGLTSVELYKAEVQAVFTIQAATS